MRTALQKLKSGKKVGIGGLCPSSPGRNLARCPRPFTVQPETSEGGADGDTTSVGGGCLLGWGPGTEGGSRLELPLGPSFQISLQQNPTIAVGEALRPAFSRAQVPCLLLRAEPNLYGVRPQGGGLTSPLICRTGQNKPQEMLLETGKGETKDKAWGPSWILPFLFSSLLTLQGLQLFQEKYRRQKFPVIYLRQCPPAFYTVSD